MARTLSSVPSVKRGTLASHNGNSEQMDRAKECIAVANEGNPADFHALETNRPCLFDAFRQCGVLAHGFPGLLHRPSGAILGFRDEGEFEMKRVVIGCDPYGYVLKEAVKRHLIKDGIEVEDLGVHAAEETRAYYEVAAEVASRVSQGEAGRGILVCGTGMGMAIIANKFPGVYAAVCENRTAAERARSINNSNVLTLGGFVTPPEQAKEIVAAWLMTEFASGWDPPIQDFLHRSMGDIHSIEQRLSGAARQGVKEAMPDEPP